MTITTLGVLAPVGVASDTPAGVPMRILQMNLCNSGIASCYEGGAVAEAQEVIRNRKPHVVTLNEICYDDIDPIVQTMKSIDPGYETYWGFKAVERPDDWDDDYVRCTNGRSFGNGIVGRVHSDRWRGVQTAKDIYDSQTVGERALRSYVCKYVVGLYIACSTHLEAGNRPVALQQCDELMYRIDPGTPTGGLWGQWGKKPTIVGGDFNLYYNGNPNVQDCVPPGWYRKGDGGEGDCSGDIDGLQHIMVTDDLTFVDTWETCMDQTDHPAWGMTVQR